METSIEKMKSVADFTNKIIEIMEQATKDTPSEECAENVVAAHLSTLKAGLLKLMENW